MAPAGLARFCETAPCRGTSLIRNSAPLGLHSRTMPRTLWWSWVGGAVSYERGTPVPARWSTTLSSEANLPHTIIFRALRGENLIAQHFQNQHQRNLRTPPSGVGGSYGYGSYEYPAPTSFDFGQEIPSFMGTSPIRKRQPP